VAQVADMNDRVDRGIHLNEYEVSTPLELPSIDDRKGRVMSFDPITGGLIQGPLSNDIQAIADNITEILDTNNQAAAAAASATASSSSASSSATSAAASATSASASEASKIASETAEIGATASAATATTKASEASTSATNAAISETNAATSASQASTSATSASASADAALAALDNFDDRYLGQKASDPTLDNDGNSLIAGALYFSTTDNVMKVYDGSVWVAAYASLSGAMLSVNNLSDVDNVATSRTNLGLATVAATGAYTDLSGKPVLGTAAATAATDYATAAQGVLADTALQDITGESIQNLSDVATMTPADGQALVYDTVNGWQAEDMAGGIAYTKQTAAYTIAANEGVIADTSAGSWTLTLPATPLAGDTVMVVDGADWSINNLTVARNGSTIEGDAEDMVMNIGGAAVQFTYDGTTWQTYVQVGALAGLGTTRVNFVATEGQTVFSVTYSAGFVDVYLNGIKLIAGTDFTATNGTTIVLTAGATAGDTVDVVAYSPFSVADTYTVAGADATFVNVTGDTVTGDLVVTGSVTAGSFVGDGSGLTGIESVPASTVIYVAQNTAPTGYVKANGAALSRTTYATLFASIGTAFGVGDGSTTFNVPDLRGEFLRGWDDGRGVDSGRAFGSFQDHQLEEHEHLVNRRTVLENPTNNSSGGGYILQDFGRANGINSSEARTVTNANAGAETRPRNVALLACIKF
jgi:microcystin-dependent protein